LTVDKMIRREPESSLFGCTIIEWCICTIA
jgi:hypothetical protein